MPQAASQATLAPGTLLVKRYRIEDLVGSGGYANVYRATDLTFGYERAIKEVHDADQGVRTQFRLEAELLINTKHPNIPHGYNLTEDRGRLYLVMEYIRGQDLEELLNASLTQQKKALDEAQVLRWAIDICDALAVVHTLPVPIIHRDIKPANIKITPEGRPVLIDFGLAKLQRAGHATMTAAQGVSPGFAPPEQYMAKGRTDARTDIYGLGATLYACLTGRDPAEAPSRLLAQTGAKGSGASALVPPRRQNPQVSEATDRIIMKALELSPGQRQPSAAQLRDELTAALRLLGHAGLDVTSSLSVPCAHCGAPNRADAFRCLHCNAPLGGADEQPRRTIAAALAPDTSAKRPAVQGQGLLTRTGQQPAVLPRRTGAPATSADGRTGQQPVVLAGRTGQHAAVAGMRQTNVHAAVARPAEALAASAAAHAVPLAEAAAPRTAPQLAVATAAPASALASAPAGTIDMQEATTAGAAPRVRDGAWVRLGETALGGFGKAVFALSIVEVLWGAIVLVLGGIAVTNQGKPFPLPQFVLVWAVVVVVVSLLAGQALSRPVYRRGNTASLRRGLQGTGLALYTVVVHGVALWGAQIFQHDQGNMTLAIIAFMLFGVNVFVVGILSILNILG